MAGSEWTDLTPGLFVDSGRRYRYKTIGVLVYLVNSPPVASSRLDNSVEPECLMTSLKENDNGTVET